jgi:hypothetical protein
MDIKKVLWIIFGFVIVGLITVAVITIVRSNITTMNNQVPTFPATTQVSDAGSVQQGIPSLAYQL